MTTHSLTGYDSNLLAQAYPKFNEAFPGAAGETVWPIIPMIGCIDPNIYKGKPEDVAACFKALGDTTEHIRAVQQRIIKPWLAAWNPEKGPVQLVKGIDQKRYIVLKIGKNPMGFCVARTALAGLAMGTIGALAYGWALYAFFTGTKRGKAMWKRMRR